MTDTQREAFEAWWNANETWPVGVKNTALMAWPAAQAADAEKSTVINAELIAALEGMLSVYGVREQHLTGGSMVSKSEVELCDKARAALSRAKEQK